MLCPETIGIIEAHEPAASNAVLDTSNAINLENAAGCLILIQEDFAVDANPVTYSVHEGATAAVAEAGTYAISATFPIWTCTASTADTWTRQTDAASWAVPAAAAAGDNLMIAFYISASILTAGRNWICLGCSAGDAGNIISAVYLIDGLRYKQASVPAFTS